MTLRRHAALAAGLFTALLAGCVSAPPIHQGAADTLAAQRWRQQESALRALTAFTVQARVAASGSYGVSGDLRWVQRGDHFTLHFSGPFGAGAVDISGTPGDVDIRTRDDHYHTADPEAFLRKTYGWTLPVTGLRDWVLGIPSAATPAAVSYDENGRLLRLLQDGWDIRYEDYRNGGGYALPWHFTMLAGETRFRVVVDEWSDVTPAAGTSGG